jgi:glycosyltransferase involved in cell wall biosynthesis
MKILAVSEHFRTTRGGTSNYVRNLCESLANLGNDVHLFTESDPDAFPCDGEWHPMAGYRVRSPAAKIPVDGSTFSGRRKLYRRLREEFKTVLSQVQPDVVHVLNGYILCKILNRVPKGHIRAWTIHNVPPQEYTFNRFQSWPLLNRSGRRLYFQMAGRIHGRTLRSLSYDRLICVSSQTRELAVHSGANPEKIHVIPNGIDSLFLSNGLSLRNRGISIKKDPIRPSLLCVAGIIPHKGQIDLVEAVAMLRGLYPEIVCVFAGAVRDLRYYRKIQSMIEREGIQDHFIFTGHVDFQELLRRYEECDIYIQPSHQEGFCISALQAIGFGKPVIATPVGSIREFFEQTRSGVIVDVANPEQMKDAIIRFVQKTPRIDPKAVRRLIRDRYSWDHVAAKTVSAYRTGRTGKSG